MRYLPHLALILVVLLQPAVGAVQQPSTWVTGKESVVEFSEYPTSAREPELATRLMSPLMAAAAAAASGQMPNQSVDLTKERFVLYVPRTTTDKGYRLLVFVPPWDGAEMPLGWASALEQEHMIFVSATDSGNGTSISGRREPLALIAAENVLHQFAVDPDRVYVGGVSGGSRVALRLALGYPDLFHGVLLHSGSDPIGDLQAPLPPANLLRKFQQSTRLVYLTGSDDSVNIELDAESRLSMSNWCVFDLHTVTMFHTGHEAADSSSLRHALDTLTTDHAPVDQHRLTACRARIDHELADDTNHVLALIHEQRLDAARKLLRHIDERYGGLAAPQSMELAKQIAAGR